MQTIHEARKFLFVRAMPNKIEAATMIRIKRVPQ